MFELIITAVFLFWLIGFWIIFRIPRCIKSRYLADGVSKVSIIIPARNEAYNLPKLLKSLNEQSFRPAEVIVVDDHSSDETAQVAKQYGARVLSAQILPENWFGKPWACQQGADAAAGSILIFLDADTFLEPDGLKRIIETFSQKHGALSINPYQKNDLPYEAFSAFFIVTQIAGMGAFSYHGNAKPSGMFGPCLVISKTDYQSCGGHAAVKKDLLENYALHAHLIKHSIPVRLLSGSGTVNIRLYPNGLKELIHGWSKSFISGANQIPKASMRLVFFWISGLCLAPIILVVLAVFGTQHEIRFGLILYILYVLQVYNHLRRVGNFPLWTSILYPLPLSFFLYIFATAKQRVNQTGTVTWKGRKIPFVKK